MIPPTHAMSVILPKLTASTENHPAGSTQLKQRDGRPVPPVIQSEPQSSNTFFAASSLGSHVPPDGHEGHWPLTDDEGRANQLPPVLSFAYSKQIIDRFIVSFIIIFFHHLNIPSPREDNASPTTSAADENLRKNLTDLTDKQSVRIATHHASPDQMRLQSPAPVLLSDIPLQRLVSQLAVQHISWQHRNIRHGNNSVNQMPARNEPLLKWIRWSRL